jgi:hypothetical protein
VQLDATYQDRTIDAHSSGSAYLSAGPLNADMRFGVDASVRIDDTWLQSLRGDAHAFAGLSLGSVRIAQASAHAALNTERGDVEVDIEASGRLSLPVPLNILAAAYFSGTGTISNERGTLAGTYGVFTPLAGSVGKWSLSLDKGFAASGHYAGLQPGPLAVWSGDSGEPAAPVSGASPKNISFGYSYFNYEASGSQIFSVGVAPKVFLKNSGSGQQIDGLYIGASASLNFQ